MCVCVCEYLFLRMSVFVLVQREDRRQPVHERRREGSKERGKAINVRVDTLEIIRMHEERRMTAYIERSMGNVIAIMDLIKWNLFFSFYSSLVSSFFSLLFLFFSSNLLCRVYTDHVQWNTWSTFVCASRDGHINDAPACRHGWYFRCFYVSKWVNNFHPCDALLFSMTT